MKTILKEFVTDMTDCGTVFLIMANIQSREKGRYYEIYVQLTESEPVIYDDSKLTIRLAKVDDYKV